MLKQLITKICLPLLFCFVLTKSEPKKSAEPTVANKVESFVLKKEVEEMLRSKMAEKQRFADEEMRQRAAELQRKEETGHGADAADRIQLAKIVLNEAFNMAQSKYGDRVEVLGLIDKYMKSTSGESRTFMMKMIELMDPEATGFVSKFNFIETFLDAMTYPEHAINLMFKLNDQNHNGVLTKYEWVQADMRKLESETSIMDLWRDAGLAFHDRDQNGDGLIDEAEYAMYALYELAKSIGKDIEDQENAIIPSK